jgi:hypothetical protein
MLSATVAEIAPDNLVLRNSSHHFRLLRTSDPVLLEKETRVYPLYRSVCGGLSCVHPNTSASAGWIILCLDTQYNFLADLSVSLPGNSWRSVGSVLATAPCGPCVSGTPLLEVRRTLPPATPSIVTAVLRGTAQPTLAISDPRAFAAGVSVGSVLLALLVMCILQVFRGRGKLIRSPAT